MKKCARDASRLKSALTIDLNTPPAAPETRQPAEILPVTQGPSTTVETEVEASTVPVNLTPIEIEVIDDDDVQLLSSPRAFTQGRNQSANRPVTVVLDDELELSTGTSVINVDDHPLQTPPNSSWKHQRRLTNKIIINCDTYVNFRDDQNAKMKRATHPPIIEQEKPEMKELVFSCPICMNSLDEACSTICGHVFCQSCIKQAIKSQKKCPTCRRKLTTSNFHRVFLPTSS